MLPLLLLLPVVFSKGISVDKKFIIKHIDSCPEEGYYFRRELSLNLVTPGPCYLCFCQNDGTATCWRRENRRCDAESYHYHNIGKRDNRVRRGIGLGDIFLRDAVRDIFNKQLPEQCKPFESSFSDGCPPADWCIGCTVCDCDANGRWDCHVLSYCPKKSTKKPALKSRKGPAKHNVIRKSAKRSIKSTSKNTLKPKSKPTSKRNKNLRKNTPHKSTNKNRSNRQPVKNHNQGRNQKIIEKRSQPPRKIVKKYIGKKPGSPRSDATKQIILPTSPKVAQAAVRKIMAAMQIMMRKDLKKGDSSKILKAVDKKHRINLRNNKKSVTQPIKQSKSTTKRNIEQKNKARNKREANLQVQNSSEVNSTVSLPKESSFIEDVMKTVTNNPVAIQSGLTTPITLKLSTVYNISPVDTIIKYVITNTTTPMNNVLDSSYYKYLENDNTVSITINPPKSKDPNSMSSQNILNNTTTLRITNFIINVSDVNKDKQNKMLYFIDKIPSGNDLKFKKWSKIKLLNDKAKRFKVELVKSMNLDSIFSSQRAKTAKLSSHINQNTTYKHQLKKIGVTKNYNIKRLVNTPKLGRDEKINMNKTNLFYVNNRITQLQMFVKNLLYGFGKNSTSKNNRKSKQFNVLKYMRKLFRKIFHSRQKKLYKNEKDFLVNKHIMETLCEYFGPCKIDPKEKKMLKIKLKDIHYETAKMLKTINIIKGLLHLIDLPSNKSVNINKTKSNFNDDIWKLNSILKDPYQKTLTETNYLQIEYIKKNTQEFVQSMGNIAILLNEIILILNNTKNEIKYYQKPVPIPVKRKSNSNKVFTSIKSLLIKYDILHNTFLKKLYDTITTFESKLNQDELAKINTEKELDNIASINRFSNNIITNLRKLRHLAQTLNSKRQKRQVPRDNDAIEYLLMLMEYLLKQNYPLDAAPVNDGIDLLLEYIKLSPDIKSIKKKVLETPSIRFVETVRSMGVNELTDGKSKFNITSTEYNSKSETNSTSKLDDTKLIEELEVDRDYDDKYIITKKSTDKSKKSTANRRNIQSSKIKDEVDSTTNREVVKNKAAAKLVINSTILDKVEERFGDMESSSKYELYINDANNENPVTETSIIDPTTVMNITRDKAKLKTGEKSEQDSSLSEITEMDWVDKDAKDYKEYKSLVHLKSTTHSSNKLKLTHKLTDDNVSVISKELKKSKKAMMNMDDVMLKKQMDLLNSLDYGTEKLNMEEDESKDASAYERYSVDTFPAYFV